MIEAPNADRLLVGELGRWLEAQAPVHAEARAESRRRVKKAQIGFFLLCFACTPAIAFPQFPWPILLAPIFAYAYQAYQWVNAPKDEARGAVKTRANEAIADALGMEYRADLPGSELHEMALAYGMVPKADLVAFEDAWWGDAGSYALYLHEAHLERYVKGGHETLFRGVMLAIRFDRSFHGTTLVAPHGAFKRMARGERDALELDGRTLVRTQISNADFEDRFDVYTTDPTEAHRLMNPTYVRRIFETEDTYGGGLTGMLFTGGEVLMVAESHDLFESGSLDPVEVRANVRETVEQIAAVCGFALTLNRARLD